VNESTISAALLAAGGARRMGRQKLLLEVDGQAIVRRVAAEIVALSPREVLVVVSPAGGEAIAAALRGLPIRIVVNERAQEGLGTSIAAAASSVAPSAEAMLLVQGDQPLVDRAMLEVLIGEWRDVRAPFVASSYAGIVTTPVVFSRDVFGELRALGGDRGARAVLERHTSTGRVVAFPVERGSDVDTPADYRRILELWATWASQSRPANESRRHG
jgi:molybdenum cofactor cytidylyltransferase